MLNKKGRYKTLSESEQPPSAKRSARFIEDCNQARERGLYQFLRHLTQGFRWDGSEWCRSCLHDAWAWWRIAQLADRHDPELYQRMLEETRPEVEEFLNHSRTIRERHAAKRTEPTTQPTPAPRVNLSVQPPEPKTKVADETTKKPRQQRPEPEQEQNKEKIGGEKKQKTVAEKPREESSLLETTGKVFSGLAHWIATGKTK